MSPHSEPQLFGRQSRGASAFAQVYGCDRPQPSDTLHVPQLMTPPQPSGAEPQVALKSAQLIRAQPGRSALAKGS